MPRGAGRAGRADRPRLLSPLVIESALGLAQPAAPALRGRQLVRQLVAARVAELLVFLGIDRVGLGEDLARDLLVIARRLRRGVGRDLGPIDGDHPDPDQPGVRAERQHLAEQLGQRALVTLAKPRDRGVIGRLIGADHARGDVLDTAPLQPPRRTLPDRVAVKQQRDHHRRIVRRPTMPVDPIGRVEPAQVKRGDGVDHEPREVPLGQPLAQARRQQQLLLAITRDEVLRHPGMVLTAPDGPPFTQQPPRQAAVGVEEPASPGCASERKLGTQHVRGRVRRE